VNLASPHIRKTFLELMSGLSLETCPSNLKSADLTVLELLAFNAPKFRGSRDRGHAQSPISGAAQNIFFGMLRGSYVPNLLKIGQKLGSQFYP